MSIVYSRRNVGDEEPHYKGYYSDLHSLYMVQSVFIGRIFPNCQKVVETLKRQNFIALIDDELQIEYRIEIADEDKNEIESLDFEKDGKVFVVNYTNGNETRWGLTKAYDVTSMYYISTKPKGE